MSSLMRASYRWAPNLTRALAPGFLQLADLERATGLRAATAKALDQIEVARPNSDHVVQNHYRFLSDVRWLQHAPLATVRKLTVRVEGVDKVQQARGAGRGLLIGCDNVGCFYTSLLAAGAVTDDLLVVTPHKPREDEEPLLDRLRQVAGISIRLVEVGPQAAILIARQWKRGGAVATMLDSYLPGTPWLVAPFMGQPAACPRGIYDLATRLGPLVVTAHSHREGAGYRIELQPPIEPIGISPEQLATRVNAQIENRILATPDEWPLWGNLPARWELARPLSTVPMAA
jgi:lauroyl/myristoyl acyltransferase